MAACIDYRARSEMLRGMEKAGPCRAEIREPRVDSIKPRTLQPSSVWMEIREGDNIYRTLVIIIRIGVASVKTSMTIR